MTIITRFAPSPTGDLHIGGARTALFNYLIAKHQENIGETGKFLLRIEDTDKKRSSPEAIEKILKGLDWLGLKHDDNYIMQSHNEKRHQEIVQKLLENDKAYLCYTGKEELDELRQKAQEQGKIFRFQSPWRDKQPSQSSKISPVVRIKTPNDGDSQINDLVQGTVKIPNSEIEDFVIARSDSTPTYMLAVVVDDFDMQVTHIIRGDDHLTNSFKQKEIYQALGWNLPHFAHIPLIHGPDGAKMSKRHGATSVIDYKEMGYLPQAMRNYLLRLGWSHGDKEIISDSEAIELFNIKNINKSAARFDFDKLNSINKFYIKNLANADLLQLISDKISQLEFIKARSQPLQDNEKQRITQALEFVKDKAITLNDLAPNCQIYLNDFKQNLEPDLQEQLSQKKPLINEIAQLISQINNWHLSEIKEQFNQFCQKNNLKIKDFGPSLRIALTFNNKSAGGIFDIIHILGKSEVEKRLKR